MRSFLLGFTVTTIAVSSGCASTSQSSAHAPNVTLAAVLPESAWSAWTHPGEAEVDLGPDRKVEPHRVAHARAIGLGLRPVSDDPAHATPSSPPRGSRPSGAHLAPRHLLVPSAVAPGVPAALRVPLVVTLHGAPTHLHATKGPAPHGKDSSVPGTAPTSSLMPTTPATASRKRETGAVASR